MYGGEFFMDLLMTMIINIELYCWVRSVKIGGHSCKIDKNGEFFKWARVWKNDVDPKSEEVDRAMIQWVSDLIDEEDLKRRE